MNRPLNLSLLTMNAATTCLAVVLVSFFAAARSNAATVAAADCTYSAVSAAYSVAASGDTVMIPAGDCQSANRWGTYLTITKDNITIRGSGAASTVIGISRGGSGFQIQANGVRITGIGFNCNYVDTSNAGVIRVGSGGGDPTYRYGDYRMDHNTFNSCGGPNGNVAPNEALTLFGYTYGLIDHNTFNDCNGECLNICADAIPGAARSAEFGQYENGTHFIEDNTFNVNRPSIWYENIIDGNSSQRFTFRYNTVNIANGAYYGSDIVSTHETCARCTGSTAAGDHASMTFEMYENIVNLNDSGTLRVGLARVRGGRVVVYNNHIRHTGSSAGRWGAGMTLSNYRSGEYVSGQVAFCGMAAYGRGLAAVCHERESGYTAEGLDAAKTTLGAALTAAATSLTLAFASGFNTAGDANGFVVRIGSEVIRYTSLSGGQLLGLTRGAQGTTPSSHAAGASVDYIKLGVCDGQPNNTYIWNNDINGVIGSALNDAQVGILGNRSIVDFTALDIRSYAERPNNWQYRTGVPYTYTPYPYPHPLQGGDGDTLPPSPPKNLRHP